MSMIENITPILQVADLAVSRHYYIETLGVRPGLGRRPDDLGFARRQGDHALRRRAGAAGNVALDWRRGCGCALRRVLRQGRRSAASRRISAGPTNFRWKIPTATFSASDRAQKPRSRSFQTILISIYLLTHDFAGKPVPTFPDRALILHHVQPLARQLEFRKAADEAHAE
jgi:hypothetical protein